MNKKIKAPIIFGAVAIIAIAFVGVITMVTSTQTQSSKTLEELYEDVNIRKATPVKGAVSLDNTSLYDELPDIEKYPLVVTGDGDIDIEIFSSGEKAGEDTDSWLIRAAKEFNDSNMTINNQTVSISVRSVSSGLAADYIISNKYLPDLYTPSNTLFGEYAIAQKGDLEIYNKRLVGNTAGIIVKDKSYKDINSIISAVQSGKLNIGYTNPQTSAAGLNLLINILRNADSSNMFSDKASKALSDFNNNIPFIALTTQQMADSASSGVLDGMVTEYQAYINDKNLKSVYTFIPFGERHDNPLYIVNKNGKSSAELEAIEMINDYLMTPEIQEIATDYGFNQNDDYKCDYETSGSEVTQALDIYKTFKDSGKDIIAVFVADCSGSMSGEAITQLKSSLSNGMQYINDNNYVGLVSYASDVTIELPIAQFDFNQKSYFQGAVDNLNASGGTSSYEAIVTAIKMVNDEKKNHPDAKTMIFLLSDGAANGRYTLDGITHVIKDSGIPIYSIGYTDAADTNELNKLSSINEAASIYADSDDIIYKIKSLFNSQL